MRTRRPAHLIPTALAAGALALTLTGCSAADDGATTPLPADPTGAATQPTAPGATAADECSVDAPCEVSFRWWGGDARRDLQLQAIAVFEEQNPDVVITAMPASWEGFFDTLTVELAAATTPDVFTVNGSWPMELGRAGAVIDLRTLSSIDLSAFPEAVLSASTDQDGHLWGMPIGGNAITLIANPALFEAAGVDMPDDETWTWADFQNIAAEITANTPAGTFGAEIGALPDLIRAFGNQVDGGLWTTDGEINITREGLIEWFALQASLEQSGAIAPASIQAEARTFEESGIAQGTTAMHAIWNNQMPIIADMLGSELVFLRLPGDFTSAHVGTFVNPGMFFEISSHARFPEAAGRFVNFMVNSPEAAEIMGTDRGVPLNPEMANLIKPGLPQPNQDVITFLERIADNGGAAVFEPAGAGTIYAATIRLSQEVMFGMITPEAAADAWLVYAQDAIAAARQ